MFGYTAVKTAVQMLPRCSAVPHKERLKSSCCTRHRHPGTVARAGHSAKHRLSASDTHITCTMCCGMPNISGQCWTRKAKRPWVPKQPHMYASSKQRLHSAAAKAMALATAATATRPTTCACSCKPSCCRFGHHVHTQPLCCGTVQSRQHSQHCIHTSDDAHWATHCTPRPG
jgi:hypothetical protein